MEQDIYWDKVPDLGKVYSRIGLQKHRFTDSFIQHIFIEYLLDVRHVPDIGDWLMDRTIMGPVLLVLWTTDGIHK